MYIPYVDGDGPYLDEQVVRIIVSNGSNYTHNPHQPDTVTYSYTTEFPATRIVEVDADGNEVAGTEQFFDDGEPLTDVA